MIECRICQAYFKISGDVNMKRVQKSKKEFEKDIHKFSDNLQISKNNWFSLYPPTFNPIKSDLIRFNHGLDYVYKWYYQTLVSIFYNLKEYHKS